MRQIKTSMLINKLDDERIDKARKRYEQGGITQLELALIYEVSEPTMRRYLTKDKDGQYVADKHEKVCVKCGRLLAGHYRCKSCTALLHKRKCKCHGGRLARIKRECVLCRTPFLEGSKTDSVRRYINIGNFCGECTDRINKLINRKIWKRKSHLKNDKQILNESLVKQ